MDSLMDVHVQTKIVLYLIERKNPRQNCVMMSLAMFLNFPAIRQLYVSRA